ncbi:MAG: hypothetical protein E7478_02910 [Ruminococcaceae bacterium]|nr:hypothetical protein [Oscillospiraceae bacterium]
MSKKKLDEVLEDVDEVTVPETAPEDITASDIDGTEAANEEAAPAAEANKMPTTEAPARTLCYIGPTIPRSVFVKGRIFKDVKDIAASYPDEIKRYPEVTALCVPVENLPEARNKLIKGNNALSMKYKALDNKIGG